MILVSGSDGFFGHFITESLASNRIPFQGFIRRKRGVRKANFDFPVTYGNLNDPYSLERAVQNSHGIIHLACTISTDFATVMDYDVKGMHALVSSWDKGHFVFASSMGVYPNNFDQPLTENVRPVPSTYYGLGKLICEKILEMKGEKTSKNRKHSTYKIFRLPFILGKHKRFIDSLFGKMILQAIQGEDFILQDSDSGACWISAEELANFIVHNYSREVSGIFNLSGGWVYWVEAVEQVIRYIHSKSKIIIQKNHSSRRKRKGRFLDTSKAEENFGFSPRRPFADEMKEIIDFFQHTGGTPGHGSK